MGLPRVALGTTHPSCELTDLCGPFSTSSSRFVHYLLGTLSVLGSGQGRGSREEQKETWALPHGGQNSAGDSQSAKPSSV